MQDKTLEKLNAIGMVIGELQGENLANHALLDSIVRTHPEPESLLQAYLAKTATMKSERNEQRERCHADDSYIVHHSMWIDKIKESCSKIKAT